MTYLFYVEIRITGQQAAGSSVSVLGNRTCAQWNGCNIYSSSFSDKNTWKSLKASIHCVTGNSGQFTQGLCNFPFDLKLGTIRNKRQIK